MKRAQVVVEIRDGTIRSIMGREDVEFLIVDGREEEINPARWKEEGIQFIRLPDILDIRVHRRVFVDPDD